MSHGERAVWAAVYALEWSRHRSSEGGVRLAAERAGDAVSDLRALFLQQDLDGPADPDDLVGQIADVLGKDDGREPLD